MLPTSPIAFVEFGNCTYRIYVSRQQKGQIILGQLKYVTPNDYSGTALDCLFPSYEELVYESQFSTNAYHEIQVVDAIVELVFHHRIASPFWDGTKTEFNPQWVFFSPSLNRSIDNLRSETGNTYSTDQSFSQLRQTYSDLIVIPQTLVDDLKLTDLCEEFNESLQDAFYRDIQSYHAPSSERKARLFKTCCLTPHVICNLIREQTSAGYKSRPKLDPQTLLKKCFGVEFLQMHFNVTNKQSEAVFNIRDPDGTFFGYFFESDLILSL